MAATRFYINFQGEKHAFENEKSMVFFLLDKQEVEIRYKNTAKIFCNLNEGTTLYNPSEQVSPNITNTFIFDEVSRKAIINSVHIVIVVIAKLHLLKKLNELDPDPEISRFMLSEKLFSSKDNTIERMDKTLNNTMTQILKHYSNKKNELQAAIFDTLNNALSKIKSRNDVDMLITSIQKPAPKSKLG